MSRLRRNCTKRRGNERKKKLTSADIFNPGIITPSNLLILLGVKCPKMLKKLPIPRRTLHDGSSKYIYLASDVMEYLRKRPDSFEDMDIDFDG